MWPLLLHHQQWPGGLLPPPWLLPLVLLALVLPPPLLLPQLLLLLPPRLRTWLPPRPWPRPHRAPLRPPLSLKKYACLGSRDDRCGPFFWGRVEYRVSTIWMISGRSRFFIACSVALTWSYSDQATREHNACTGRCQRFPFPFHSFGYSCFLVYAVPQWGCCRREWWSHGTCHKGFESPPYSLGHTTSQGRQKVFSAPCISSD